VAAFTIESYQWLDEMPADILSQPQLRVLLNKDHDPSMDHFTPTMFNVSPILVWINTLWFVRLTLALTAVVISILCKQWLHEYQQYDNFTTKQSFCIHRLHHQGL
jgi:hypothetical protein